MIKVNYTLTVYIAWQVDDGDDPNQYIDAATKRALEKDVIRALSRIDRGADCEVMDTEIVNDGKD